MSSTFEGTLCDKCGKAITQAGEQINTCFRCDAEVCDDCVNSVPGKDRCPCCGENPRPPLPHYETK